MDREFRDWYGRPLSLDGQLAELLNTVMECEREWVEDERLVAIGRYSR